MALVSEGKQLLAWRSMFLSLVFILGACGDKDDSKKNFAPASSDLTLALDCSTPKGAKKKSTSSEAPEDDELEDDEIDDDDLEDDEIADGTEGEGVEDDETALWLQASDELRKVPAESLFVKGDDGAGNATQMSLCDVLRGKEKKIGFFHIVGTECYSCMKWLESTTAGLEANGQNAEVLSVAVLTDKEGLLNKPKLDQLKLDLGGDTVWVQDVSQQLRRFFTDDALAPLRPTLLIMDTVASGFLVNDPALDAKALVTKANDMMGLDITPAP